jgi:E3 ubiquitin-protein ligase UBR4
MAYVFYHGELNGSDGFGDLPTDDEHSERGRILTKQLLPYLNELLQVTVGSSEIPAVVVDNLNSLLPSIKPASKRLSPVGSVQRARRTLHQLHHDSETIVASKSLMILTLVSQEGTFENVRMSFTGDRGQTIKQLLLCPRSVQGNNKREVSNILLNQF